VSASDKVFAGSIPEFYDTYLVPLIFEAPAADLARRIAATQPTDILEIAAGTGVLTRALAPLLPPSARYVVTDLNQPMLDWAAARQVVDDRITWRQADALALPFDDATFDTVCCQFGAMFFPDRAAGYREARRVLKPGGRFIFNTWDSIAHNDFARVVIDALAEIFPDNPPRFLVRTPHGYHDVALIEDDLRRAGFGDIAIVTNAAVSSAPSARDPATAYCQGTPLRGEIEALDAPALNAATIYAGDAVARIYGPGPVSAKIQSHVIVARV
jgi:SAM-dependent methyltransferase